MIPVLVSMSIVTNTSPWGGNKQVVFFFFFPITHWTHQEGGQLPDPVSPFSPGVSVPRKGSNWEAKFEHYSPVTSSSALDPSWGKKKNNSLFLVLKWRILTAASVSKPKPNQFKMFQNICKAVLGLAVSHRLLFSLPHCHFRRSSLKCHCDLSHLSKWGSDRRINQN